MGDAQAAVTNNWDTVSAIKFKAVNEAIVNQKSSPKSFSGIFSSPFSGDFNVTGDFGDWQLSGGSGNLVHMKLPFTHSKFTPKSGGAAKTPGAGYGIIEINLTYIPQPCDTNKQDLQVDAKKAVQSVAVTMSDSSQKNFASYIGHVLTEWLSSNLQDFNHVFAVANLGEQESSPAFTWLKPTKVGYAVEAPVNASVDDFVFGVLAMTQNRAGTDLTYQVSPNALPSGYNGGFLINFVRFMNEIFLPGVVPIFDSASTSDFTVTSDGTQVTNNKDLTFADFEIPTNKSGSETRTVSDATIDKGKFTLTAFDTYLELQFNDLTFTFEEGYIAHLTYTGYQEIGVTSSNHFKFSQPAGKPPVLNVTITETTGEKWKELIDSIVIGVVFAVVGAMIGGALGPAAEEAGEAGETAATDAAEDAAGSSMDFDVTAPEDSEVNNLDDVESESENEAADSIEEPSRAQKFKGFFRRNWSKILGMAIGGAVGAVVSKIPDILRNLAEDDLDKVPTLNEFAEEAVAPVVFSNTKSFELKTIQMNGSVQMGLNVTFDD